MLEKQGLVKLAEECGELIQIAAKKMTRMECDEHWDNQGSLKERLEDEIAEPGFLQMKLNFVFLMGLFTEKRAFGWCAGDRRWE